MTTELKDYEVTEVRFINGQHRTVGEKVQMTERAAKYYVPPYGTGLKLVSEHQAKPGAKVGGKPADKVAKAES